MSTLIDSKSSDDGRNPNTGEHWLDEGINRRAEKKSQWQRVYYSYDYDLFDREGYIGACLEAGRPVVITWVPSTTRLHCRHYQDVFGVPDPVDITHQVTMPLVKDWLESIECSMVEQGYRLPKWERPKWLKETEGRH